MKQQFINTSYASNILTPQFKKVETCSEMFREVMKYLTTEESYPLILLNKEFYEKVRGEFYLKVLADSRYVIDPKIKLSL